MFGIQVYIMNYGNKMIDNVDILFVKVLIVIFISKNMILKINFEDNYVFFSFYKFGGKNLYYK